MRSSIYVHPCLAKVQFIFSFMKAIVVLKYRHKAKLQNNKNSYGGLEPYMCCDEKVLSYGKQSSNQALGFTIHG